MVGVAQETIGRLGDHAAAGELEEVRQIVEEDPDWLNTCDARGATALIRAIEKDKVEVVDYLLSKGAKVNVATSDGWTPLHHCVSKGRGFLECLRLLLQHGAKINQGNSDNNAALNLCAMNNFDQCALALIDAGADINRVNSARWSALMQACSKGRGYLTIVELLVKHGADLDLVKDDGDTALGLCCLNGFADCAGVLVRCGAKVNTQKTNLWTPLMHCCGKGRGHEEIAKLLLENGADPEKLNDDGNSALAICCMNGFAGIARLLLAHKPDVNRQSKGGWGMLHQTVCKGRGSPAHAEIARLLIKSGADINLRNHEMNTALNLAAMNGFTDLARLLVDSGADINSRATDGWSPLHCCCGSGRGYFDIAKLLVDKGAKVDARNEQGVSPLGLCAMNNFKEIAEILLAAGADVNSQSDAGWTALMDAAAAGRGHLGIAKLLLGAGLDLNLQNSEGYTALHLACLHHLNRLVALLVQKGADLNVTENDGWTPLHCACSQNRGFVNIAKILIDNGCDINALDNDGWHALHFCLDWDSPRELLELLLDHGVDANILSRKGDSPLSLACKHGFLDKVKLLVQRGASLTSPRCEFDLRRECRQGHRLQSKTVSKDESFFCMTCAWPIPPFSSMQSCQRCQFEVCQNCAKSATPIFSNASLLQLATLHAHADTVAYLTSLKAPPATPQSPPAAAAAASASTSASGAGGGDTAEQSDKQSDADDRSSRSRLSSSKSCWVPRLPRRKSRKDAAPDPSLGDV